MRRARERLVLGARIGERRADQTSEARMEALGARHLQDRHQAATRVCERGVELQSLRVSR